MYLGPFLSCYVYRVVLYSTQHVESVTALAVLLDDAVNKGEMLFSPLEKTGRPISV